jgi:iron complex transport system permease protein
VGSQADGPAQTGVTRFAGATAPARAVAGYDALVRHRIAIVVALGILAVAAFVLDLGTGPSSLGLRELLDALLGSDGVARSTISIVWQVRLPQACLALLVGVALALAGAEMQTILNNPLASPFTLGVSSAAAFGAALAIVAGSSLPGVAQNWTISANAFVFAFGSVLLLQAMARAGGSGVDTLVLCGIALFFTFNALTALMQFLASQQALQQLVFWIMGSLARASWDKVQVLAIVVAATIPFSLMASAQLTLLRLGEDRARSAGVNVGRLRFASLLRVSLLTAAAMAFVGTIGFVGLAGPHIARLLVGEDHRFFLPASAMTGAIIMALASVASKAIVPGVLIPIGIVTALIGLPVFFSLILRRRSVA